MNISDEMMKAILREYEEAEGRDNKRDVIQSWATTLGN